MTESSEGKPWQNHKVWYDNQGNAWTRKKWHDEPRYILVLVIIGTTPMTLLFADNYSKQLEIMEKIPELSCEEIESGLAKMSDYGRLYSPSGSTAMDEWEKRCAGKP